MRYKISEIEDQIIATLRADTTNFTGVMTDTFAGQVSAQMFMNPEYMEGFVKLLPFCLVSYQGRTANKAIDRDSSGKTYIHTLTFRLFVGAKSLRSTQESARAAYTLLAAVFDDLHAKVPYCSPQQLAGYTALSGTVVSSSEFNPLSAIFEAGGTDEALVVNLPGIVVYRTDYSIKLLA